MDQLIKILDGMAGSAMTSIEPRGEPDPNLELWSQTRTACVDPFFSVSSSVLVEPSATFLPITPS